MAKNLHLEHPEDQLLTGDDSVISWFYATSSSSVKMDGAPAIVWGTNPENGEFFVGTKSVFNKKKIKICYTQNDITTLYGHQPNVVSILTACLAYLPRTDVVYQGDFIGFGGDDTYTPNTVTYVFPEVIQERIIMAPHTFYVGEKMTEMDAFPILSTLDESRHVCFVQPTVDIYNNKANWEEFQRCYDEVKEADGFLGIKRAAEAKIIINQLLRNNKYLSIPLLTEIFGTKEMAILYTFALHEKFRILEDAIYYDGPQCLLDGDDVESEGIVRTNQFGSMKLVNRYIFSVANFNNTKFGSVK
jgi:hypothetical protein